MSESAKKTNQTKPESYSPKKPEILNMAQTAGQNNIISKKYQVKYVNGDKYMDGVPMLKWGEWKDNTYCGSIAMVAQVLNIPVSYETLMGVSGLCYRFAMKPDWCPSSALVQNGKVWDDNINAVLGIEIYSIFEDAERDNTVKRSIDLGIPVICMGQIGSPEWGIITGYSEDTDAFFGRSYFDAQNTAPGSVYYQHDNVFHTDNHYRRAINYPGTYPQLFIRFFDQPCSGAVPVELLKKSLEICLEYDRHDEVNDCRFGKAALDILIDGFKKNDHDWNSFRRNENYHLGVLVDARRSAHIYLHESARLLSGSNQEKLNKVSLLYKSTTDAILSVMPYKMLNEHFAFNGSPKEAWSIDVRKKLVDVLCQIIEVENEIQSLIKSVLDNWEDQP